MQRMSEITKAVPLYHGGIRIPLPALVSLQAKQTVTLESQFLFFLIRVKSPLDRASRLASIFSMFQSHHFKSNR